MKNPTRLIIPRTAYQTESSMAYCFLLEGQQVWLPKSQVRDLEIIGKVYVLFIPEWLVEAKDLQEYVEH